jgi:predicted RNA binding protein YcfA (HicA-like mRNA interferase family)
MKIPRDVYGRDFANHLIRHWDFSEVRQTGSHIVIRTETPFGRTVSIPAHKPMRTGTFRDAAKDVAEHKGVTLAEVLHGL